MTIAIIFAISVLVLNIIVAWYQAHKKDIPTYKQELKENEEWLRLYHKGEK